ncbi:MULTISPECIES: hypothetical protein [Roseomonadaceae]|uniref:Uncharacterized protein n=1 Tax=Falsiroseomonas oleicola TaxID=2801474 RepID=A0ABS6HFQ7_9PROT|nr:hypothetical protein [Roseomonas oleicola]MBU8547244.1 hypothetical protein [Roseomonas oleicola]
MSRSRKPAGAPPARAAKPRKRQAAEALPFAHLIGADAVTASGKRSEEDERDDDKDEDRRDASAAEDDDDDKDRAQDDDGDDDKDRAEEDDDDEKAEEDDEEEEDKPKGSAAARQAARSATKAERARCRAIFTSKHAAGRVAAACSLAFDTGMSAKAAIGVLKSLPREGSAAGAGQPSLSDRMAALGGPRPTGTAPAPSGRQAIISSWDAAAQRAGIARK